MDSWLHGRGDRLRILKVETPDDRVDVGHLGQRECASLAVALNSEPEYPVDGPLVRDLEVLAKVSLHLIHELDT